MWRHPPELRHAAIDGGQALDLVWEAVASVYVSPISLYKIGQKTRLGKWPEIELLAPPDR